VLVTTNRARLQRLLSAAPARLLRAEDHPRVFCKHRRDSRCFLHEYGHGIDQNDATGTGSRIGHRRRWATASPSRGPALLRRHRLQAADPYRHHWATGRVWNSTTAVPRRLHGVRAPITPLLRPRRPRCLSRPGPKRGSEPGTVIVQGSHSGPIQPHRGRRHRPADTMICDDSTIPTRRRQDQLLQLRPRRNHRLPGPLGHVLHCESTIARRPTWISPTDHQETSLGEYLGRDFRRRARPRGLGWSTWTASGSHRDTAVSATGTGPLPSGTHQRLRGPPGSPLTAS